MTHRRFRYIDLEKLRVFHAVASAGSFSAAARASAMSQPSVSGHVKDLERMMGLALFERSGRGVRLTVAGEDLAGYARRIFDIEAEAHEDLAAVGAGLRGRVRVAASSTPGTYLLPRILGDFKRADPSIGVELTVTDSADALQRVASSAADLGVIGSLPTGVRRSNLLIRPWVDDELVLIAPRSHRWVKDPPKRANLIAEEAFLMREKGSSIRAMTEDWLRAKGVTVSIEMELGNPEAIINAVAAGLGVSIISRSALPSDGSSAKVRVISIPGLPIRRRLQVVNDTRTRGSAASVRLKEFLFERK